MTSIINPHMRIVSALDNSRGNAIQVYIDQTPVLWAGNFLNEHHELLDDLLMQHHIPFEMQRKAWLDFPCIQGTRYQMVGAGSINFDQERRLITLSESNQLYGIGPHRAHAEEFLAAMKRLGPWEYDRIDIKE